MTLSFFKPPLLICNWFMFSFSFLRCGPFCLSFAFWLFSLKNCFIMGFFCLIFNCFTFVCTNLLVWLNPYLVNITQFSFLQFKIFYTFLHFLLYDIIFNDFKLYIYCWYLKAHSQVWDKFWQLKALEKWWKIFFIWPLKLFSFSKYLTFWLTFFDRVTKRLDFEDKVNFKFYDVTAWLTNNCNTHIVQYLGK